MAWRLTSCFNRPASPPTPHTQKPRTHRASCAHTRRVGESRDACDSHPALAPALALAIAALAIAALATAIALAIAALAIAALATAIALAIAAASSFKAVAPTELGPQGGLPPLPPTHGAGGLRPANRDPRPGEVCGLFGEGS